MERRTKTPPGKKPSRRYARESQQEDRSEGQIFERFAQLGWPRNRMGRDLGEDLLVQIYDDGHSTGLSFYVQLKSAANAERLRRKKSPALAYPLEVKDLLHWEVSATLVFLVVWDVEKREGWWESIPEIIKALDGAGTGWRKKKSATVTVPLGNTTDDHGMKRLRWAVADHWLPLVQKKGELRAKLSFPPTDDGRAAAEALDRLIDFGDPAEISTRFITEIHQPEWMQRLYGDQPVQDQTVVLSTKPSPRSILVRIEAESPDGIATLQHAELRVKSQGRKRVVLSNEHQSTPIHIRAELMQPAGPHRAYLTIDPHTEDIFAALDTANFELAISQPSSKVRIIDARTGAILWESSELSALDAPEQLRERRDFLDKLCFIQRRITNQGTLSLQNGVSPEDYLAAGQIFKILSTGKEHTKLSMTLPVRPHSSTRALAQIAAGSSGDFSFEPATPKLIKLLNLELNLGKFRFSPENSSQFAKLYLEKAQDATRLNKTLQLDVQSLPFIIEYLDWLPIQARWEHLSTLANRQEGYVTIAQAGKLGYSEDIFLELSARSKVRRATDDVYHLTQFPHAEREDLLILWLQTDRLGVISHETALSLHQLCDILPAHLHVTVPPGWSPRDRALASDVEIRRADIPADDIRWLGAVPYTSALRTVRDCIEVGVSPELIEQAIAEGIRRGLFTAADLPPHGHARSA